MTAMLRCSVASSVSRLRASNATLVMTVLCAIMFAAPAGAQIPDEFTNLEVLPADIDKRALIDEMRGFAGALGVRCKHCHVGEATDSLEGFDFVSDEKEAKRVARAMMRMTREINDTLLPKTGRENLLAVGCVTCHRGVERPQELLEILAAELEAGGVDGVGKTYRELHEKYYGKGAYNFSEFTLTSLAERVARGQNDAATAFGLLDLNAELHLTSAYTFIMKGRIQAMSGDREGAVKSLERALEIEPDHAWARQQLERLKAAPAADKP